ncbi:MAG: molybdopterin molybdotransferase MoeA [Campylobacterota bacterium]|nr:molybdopterin molybdotransferase MoeA [Campylobacterota bacterium]
MITYEQSIKELQNIELEDIGYERVFLSDALGRVLNRDIVAQHNYPQAPTASMDGYAIKHANLADGRIKINSTDNPAGSSQNFTLSNSEAIKTFTGSLMPSGSDTLINIENVHVEDDYIVIDKEVPYGFSVRPCAESYAKGDVLLKKGTLIEFAQIGVLAELNTVMVEVVKKPTVAILATGSEILDIGQEKLYASQIRSSNNYTLEALSKMSGASTVQLGTCKDDFESIKEAYNNALHVSDIVVSTGGVSVGDYDFVKDVIPALGAKVIYKGVKIKPGQHIMLAQKANKLIVALPGFAYSSTVTFLLYVVPIIAKILHRSSPLKVLKATLNEDWQKRTKKSEFSACNVHVVDGKYEVDFEDKRAGSSAILTNLLENSGLMITHGDSKIIKKGSEVEVILLEKFI